MIDVSCAIIIYKNKLLAVQRGAKTDHPFQWEFPGGKVKPGETAEASIIREIQEELSIGVEVLDRLEYIEHDYKIKQIRLIPFICRIKSGMIQLKEHIDLRWILPGETDSLSWSEADRMLIQKNSDYFSNKNLIKADLER